MVTLWMATVLLGVTPPDVSFTPTAEASASLAAEESVAAEQPVVEPREGPELRDAVRAALKEWARPDDKQADYAEKIEKMLKNQRIRVISDLRNEKIGFKIREHTLKRIPYMIVVGDREVEEGMIAVRDQAGKDLGVMQIDEFINLVNEKAG